MLLDFKSKKENNSPIFYGEPLGIQRYDNIKYQEIERLTKKQLSFFWIPEEFSLVKDKIEFEKLDDKKKHIFISNIKYQTLLDTIQSRGPSILKRATSYPEIESFIIVWEFFENIHSRSYTHILRNLFSDPSKVFDSILEDDNIIKRARSTIEAYNKLDEGGDNKELLLDALIQVNVLEGIRFYVSFACAFYFTEFYRVMEGNSKIISSVQADEQIHLQFTQTLINILNRDDREFSDLFKKKRDYIYDCYKVAADQEKEWAAYLWSDDPLMLSKVERYVEYLVNSRLRAIKLDPIYPVTRNPIPWINSYTSFKDVQDAPQETEINSYIIGVINMDGAKIEESLG